VYEGEAGGYLLWDGDQPCSGALVLRRLTSSVEQTCALCATMLAEAQAHPAMGEALAVEQKAALTGVAPDAPINSEVLAGMPLLKAFALETLRFQPPARPNTLRLEREVVCEGLALPSGSLVAPEPYIGHFLPGLYPQPDTFNPDRFLEEHAPLPTLGFAGEAGFDAGSMLAIDVAMATFVQMRRMFELQLPKDLPPVSGFPLRTLPESCEVLAKPGMFYEIQRGVKKLRF